MTLEKTSAEKFFDATIEKLLNNDIYFIKHRNGINAFCIRKDQKKLKKTKLLKLLKLLIEKLKKYE